MNMGRFEIGDIVTLNSEKIISFSKEWEYNIEHFIPLWNQEGIIAEINLSHFRIFFPAHPPPDHLDEVGDGIYWSINPIYLKGRCGS
jgi:hypothetical protein